jgi:hypothetical protein
MAALLPAIMLDHCPRCGMKWADSDGTHDCHLADLPKGPKGEIGRSQVFYMGDNSEVLIASDPSGPSGMPGPTGTCGIAVVGPFPTGPTGVTDDPYIDFDIGYAAAIKDVLREIIVSGKQNLVQWLEKKLEQL